MNKILLFLADAVDGSEVFHPIWEDENELIVALISTAVIIISFMVILLMLKLIIKKYTKVNKGKKKHAITLANMLYSAVKYIAGTIMIIVLLSVWGINVKPLLAGAGIVALAISLGAQKFISDLINGMFIVFQNYYDVDDVVEINGFKGRVMEVNVKSTKLINWKNEMKIIANGNVNDVINYSRAPSVALVEVEIDYKENIDQVVALLNERLLSLRENYKQIIEGPYVNGVTDLGASGVKIGIIVKTDPEEYYEVVREMRKFIKNLFDTEQILIPYNQVVIHNADNQ